MRQPSEISGYTSETETVIDITDIKSGSATAYLMTVMDMYFCWRYWNDAY